MVLKNKKVVLGVTGSIAAYKAPDIVRRLHDQGAVVSVIMTKEAQEFITPLTFESLTQTKVGLDMFARKEVFSYIQHIRFAQEADILLIAPATANIIGKIASGIANDLLTCTALAVKAPIMIAPAMNDAMFHNNIVQDNCKKLKQYGVKIIDPVKGLLACGTEGEGHLAEVDIIVEAVEKIFL